MGAGDGHFALATARSDPNALVIALDASTDRLADGARTALRRRTPNILFVVAPIERLPDALLGVAGRVTIHFPWGSLLRGVTYGDDPVLAPLASLARAGGRLDLVLQTADVAVDAFAAHGFVLVDRHVATPAEVSETRSSWAKRLGIGRGRPAFAFRFARFEDG